MLKIGEFSKLSHLTVKTLRFYEKEGLLRPAQTDPWNGYRYYETGQLQAAARIRAYRQLGLSIEEIRAIQEGADPKQILEAKAQLLLAQKSDIDMRLSIIHHILEENNMKYQATIKEIPAAIVYYTEARLSQYSDMMQLIPQIGAEMQRLNPDIRCAEPHYEFCEYLDGEYRETDILVRHNEAVDRMGKESDLIRFREVPAVKVLSIFHKGPYDKLGDAYAYLMKYAEDNGYRTAGYPRECYIDGIWNKETPDEWLTEIQLPIE